jgi:rhodanese-related sulfurtransferase
MKGYKFIFLLHIIFIFVLFSPTGFGQGKADYQNLDPEEFYIKMNKQVESVVIDVRLVQDYHENRIPRSVPAPEPKNLKSLADTLDKKTPLLVYCYDGDRSKTACKILTGQLGFKHVFNLKKGLEMWEKMGFPMDTTTIKSPEEPY